VTRIHNCLCVEIKNQLIINLKLSNQLTISTFYSLKATLPDLAEEVMPTYMMRAITLKSALAHRFIIHHI
jgi:hypothetical protein